MIFRFTKTIAEHFDFSTPLESGCAENRYCEWFVDIAYNDDNREYFLLTNAYSLFSIAVPTKGLNDLPSFWNFVLQETKEYFYEKKLGDLFEKYIAPNLQKIDVAKTNNRSVTASIQGLKMIIACSNNLSKKNPDQYERFILNDQLNQNLCKCANTGAGDYTVAERFISSDLMKLPMPEEKKTASSQKAGQKTKVTRRAYQLYAGLCGMEEKVWRRFLIPSNATMEYLAFALMAQFNMDGSHLYSFKIPQLEDFEMLMKLHGFPVEDIPEITQLARDIEIVSDYDEEMDTDEDNFYLHELERLPPIRYAAYDTKLKSLIKKGLSEFDFYYDFGDGWQFKVICEEKDVPSTSIGNHAHVLEGKGLGIIENCGGIGGLDDLRKAFKKQKGEDYENYSEWLGVKTLDLDSFDADKINADMKNKIKLFKSMWYEK